MPTDNRTNRPANKPGSKQPPAKQPSAKPKGANAQDEGDDENVETAENGRATDTNTQTETRSTDKKDRRTSPDKKPLGGSNPGTRTSR